MKFNCKKEDLQAVLSLAHSIVNPKSTLSILSNVLIETEGPHDLYITATDLEIGAKCLVKAEVIDQGSVTLPAKKFFDVVKGFPIRDLTIEISENNVASLTSESTLVKILGLPKDEFPKFPEVSMDRAITIGQAVFKKMLQRTVYAISEDSTRYVLTGLYMSFKDGNMHAVATDGKRLSVVKKEISIPEGMEEAIIVPAKTVNEVMRSLKEEGDVLISIVGNHVAFKVSNILIVSRLIEGHFPDYGQVIPEKTDEKIIINREELLSAISRASIFTDEKSNSVKIKVSKNKLTLSSNIAEVGESKEEIDLTYEGKEILVAFNPSYLIDVLKTIENEEVTLELSNSESPGVIRTNETFTYVIMPMRMA